jgi:hypothetical protein
VPIPLSGRMWNLRRVALFYTAELPSRQEIRRNGGAPDHMFMPTSM